MTGGASNQLAGLSAPSVFPRWQRLCAALLFSALSLLPLSATAQTASDSKLGELKALAQAGMADFSLALLERDLPSFSANPDGWMEWQQQKLAIFRQQGEWQHIIDEYEAMPAEAPVVYQSWLRLRTVEAYLGQGDGESARDLLSPLIWGSSGSDDGLAELRRLVIMSYLVEGRQGDAHSAMLRYEQDYSDAADDPAWIAIKTRVMIADGHPDDAALVAVVSEEPEGKALYALAHLKGYAAMDEQLLRETMAALNNRALDQPLRQELFAAALEKMSAIPVWAERIAALQQLVVVPEVSGSRITAAVDALWHAYSEHGQEVANRLQLLVGDFTPWFEAASQLQATSPMQAEALYVWLAHHAGSVELQAKAHELFVELLFSDQRGYQQGHPQGDELLRTLYLSSSQYTDLRTVPLAVIYQLVDLALSEADLAHAAQLMSQLDKPNGVDLLEWQLRRARLQILTGAPQAGGTLLLELVNGQSLSAGQIDYLLKAIFDLQNANQQEQAYAVLAALLPRLPDLNLHREVLYWMADARLALGEPLEAARLYLRSAMLIGPDTRDEWALAARYQAAQALIKAGVVTDGVAIYRSLLQVMENPEHRALLQREIQRHSAQH